MRRRGEIMCVCHDNVSKRYLSNNSIFDLKRIDCVVVPVSGENNNKIASILAEEAK